MEYMRYKLGTALVKWSDPAYLVEVERIARRKFRRALASKQVHDE